jgi:hypothetical protein
MSSQAIALGEFGRKMGLNPASSLPEAINFNYLETVPKIKMEKFCQMA